MQRALLTELQIGVSLFEDLMKIFESSQSWSLSMSESKDEKRVRLIETAIEAIGRYGIKKTTLEDIAKAAGMATTSMYYYFPNKNELMRTALASVTEALLAEVEAIVRSSDTPERKLISSWRTLFSSAKRSGFLVNLDAITKSEVLHLVQDLVEDFNRRYTLLIRRILEQGKAEGDFQVNDFEPTATVLSVGVMSLLMNTAGQTQFDLIERRIEELGELIMNGLRKR
jgi:AcrR family transcriptional regulator